jgi:hypothetical protein
MASDPAISAGGGVLRISLAFWWTILGMERLLVGEL